MKEKEFLQKIGTGQSVSRTDPRRQVALTLELIVERETERERESELIYPTRVGQQPKTGGTTFEIAC